jgi:hypothetical protein
MVQIARRPTETAGCGSCHSSEMTVRIDPGLRSNRSSVVQVARHLRDAWRAERGRATPGRRRRVRAAADAKAVCKAHPTRRRAVRRRAVRNPTALLGRTAWRSASRSGAKTRPRQGVSPSGRGSPGRIHERHATLRRPKRSAVAVATAPKRIAPGQRSSRPSFRSLNDRLKRLAVAVATAPNRIPSGQRLSRSTMVQVARQPTKTVDCGSCHSSEPTFPANDRPSRWTMVQVARHPTKAVSCGSCHSPEPHPFRPTIEPVDHGSGCSTPDQNDRLWQLPQLRSGSLPASGRAGRSSFRKRIDPRTPIEPGRSSFRSFDNRSCHSSEADRFRTIEPVDRRRSGSGSIPDNGQAGRPSSWLRDSRPKQSIVAVATAPHARPTCLHWDPRR